MVLQLIVRIECDGAHIFLVEALISRSRVWQVKGLERQETQVVRRSNEIGTADACTKRRYTDNLRG